MKKVENGAIVAQIMENFFKADFPDFNFEKSALLVKTPHVEGPIWMLQAEKNGHVYRFVLEVVGRLGYFCPVDFDYEKVNVESKTLNIASKDGKVGKVLMHNNEISIIWDD